MNPNNQQPSMTPQMPQQAMQAIMGSGGSAQPANAAQAATAGQSGKRGGKPQLPDKPFTAAHNHIYNALRSTLMNLVQQGVPGIEEVLTALNNSHVNQLKNASQQPPQMPQQQPQIPPQVLAQLMQGGGGQPSPSENWWVRSPISSRSNS